jgi:hypothetical protein
VEIPFYDWKKEENAIHCRMTGEKEKMPILIVK